MEKIKIGFLYAGNYSTLPWGSAVTTFYLSKAFKTLGHTTWLYSVTDEKKPNRELIKNTDLIISEGVPDWQIPNEILELKAVRIFWWLSNLFYDISTIKNLKFDGIATNSKKYYDELNLKDVAVSKIDLCADETFASAPINKSTYDNFCVYLGKHQHKNISQTDLIFENSSQYNLGIWGTGWEISKYSAYYKRILPFTEIGSLYRSSEVAFLLTEQKQKVNGMFNNRTYEILICGCIAISEKFEDLENSELGEFINFAENKEQVEEILKAILRDKSLFLAKSLEAKKNILEKHNYKIRAIQFYDFYKYIKS
jgi:spore maturation protein CgeB